MVTVTTLVYILDIIDELTIEVEPHDRVRLTITSRHLTHEIWLPFFMRLEELTADRGKNKNVDENNFGIKI